MVVSYKKLVYFLVLGGMTVNGARKVNRQQFFLRRIAQHLFQGRIDHEELPIIFALKITIRRLSDQGAEARLRSLESLAARFRSVTSRFT